VRILFRFWHELPAQDRWHECPLTGVDRASRGRRCYRKWFSRLCRAATTKSPPATNLGSRPRSFAVHRAMQPCDHERGADRSRLPVARHAGSRNQSRPERPARPRFSAARPIEFANYFLFRASLQRPSFQYINVPQLPGRFAEAIRVRAVTARRAFRELRLGPATARCASYLADRAPLASADGRGLKMITESAAAKSTKRPERIDPLLRFPKPSTRISRPKLRRRRDSHLCFEQLRLERG